MSARARRPTDLGTGDMRGEYAPRRTLPSRDPASPAPESFEQDPTEVGPRTRVAAAQATTLIDGRHRLPGEPGVVPAVRGAERSEPIRVISMKDRAEAQRRPTEEMQVPRQVQLRSLAEVSRRRADTPVGLGHLAPPRDPREVRARRMRANLWWACVALGLAAAIALAIWLVAGR
jgi:hypothetical protein